MITLAPTSSRRRLEEYLEYKVGDDVVDPLDIPIKEYALKVREAFADLNPVPSVGVGVLEPEIEIVPEYPPAAGFQPEFEKPATPEAPVEEKKPEEVSERPNEAIFQTAQSLTTEQETKQEVRAQEPSKPTQTLPSGGQSQQKEPTLSSAPVYEAKPVQKQRPIQAIHLPRQPMTLTPMTPDMHSGRRFTNLVPRSGELVLPIRGERVIKTSEEIEVEEDIKVKAERLQQLLSQARADGSVFVPKPEINRAQQQVSSATVEAKDLSEKLESEKQRLSDEISKLESEKSSAQTPSEAEEKDAMIKRLEVEKQRTESDRESLQRQILDLQNKLKIQQEATTQSVPKATIIPATYIPGTTITGKANIVSGVVRLKDGTTKDGILLIMKNQKGEAVRAFKTNSLGQFKLSTPLTSGVYTIEVVSENTGATFDIISVEVKGEPIPPVEIIGH